jgi:hypothetical protein
LIEDSTRLNGKDCIRFVEHTNERNLSLFFVFAADLMNKFFIFNLATFIKVFSDGGCYSYVGKQVREGAQMLSLEIPGFFELFIIIL